MSKEDSRTQQRICHRFLILQFQNLKEIKMKDIFFSSWFRGFRKMFRKKLALIIIGVWMALVHLYICIYIWLFRGLASSGQGILSCSWCIFTYRTNTGNSAFCYLWHLSSTAPIFHSTQSTESKRKQSLWKITSTGSAWTDSSLLF